VYGAGNVVIVGLFAVSWLLRPNDKGYEPSVPAFVHGVIGVGLVLLTARLGGEMVYRLRVAVSISSELHHDPILRLVVDVETEKPDLNSDRAENEGFGTAYRIRDYAPPLRAADASRPPDDAAARRDPLP
jgi:hypothetical protein